MPTMQRSSPEQGLVAFPAEAGSPSASPARSSRQTELAHAPITPAIPPDAALQRPTPSSHAQWAPPEQPRAAAATPRSPRAATRGEHFFTSSPRRLGYASPTGSPDAEGRRQHSAGGSPQPPASPALAEARAGVADAEAVLQAAHRQRRQLWGLADRLMAMERERSKAAEGQLWEARHQAGTAQLHAEAAEAAAAQHSAAAEVAEAAARLAVEQLAAAQRDRDTERARTAGLETALASAHNDLHSATAEREEMQQQLAAAAEAEQRQRAAAVRAVSEAAALRQELDGARQALGAASSRVVQAEGQLVQEREQAAVQVEELTAQTARAEAEADSFRAALAQVQAAARALEADNGAVRQRLEAAQGAADAALERAEAERQRAEQMSAELPGLGQQLGEANGHVEALAAECDSLAAELETAQRAAQQAETAAAAAAQRYGAELGGLRVQLAQHAQHAGQQAAELSDKSAALEAQQGIERELRAALAEAAGFADAAEREAGALRLSLRLAASERAEAEEELQLVRAELSSLRLDHSALSRQWQCVEGSEDACRELGLSELEQLVQMIEGAAPLLRNILTERRVEAARSEMAAAASHQACIVCCSAQRDTFLNCGHLVCRTCSERMSACPVCRAAITSRTRAFV